MSKIRKGFTLIEVAVVLVVLAILAAIAIPTFAAFMDGVDERAAAQEAAAIQSDARALDALDGVQNNDWDADVATAISESSATTSYDDATDTLTVTGSRGSYDFVLTAS